MILLDISHLSRVLCLIFVNQIHEEEPGTRKKALTTKGKTVLDTLVRKLKFTHSSELERGSSMLFSIMLTTVPFGIGETWRDNIHHYFLIIIYINLKMSLSVKRGPFYYYQTLS